MNKILKTSSILILSLFLGAMFLSLFQMSFSTDTSHHGMEDCPFMSHSEILCSMNVTDHIEAWQSVFSSILINTFALLILSFVVALKLPAFFLKKYNPFPPLYRKIRKHIYTYFYRPLQELFSNGILNPKLF